MKRTSFKNSGIGAVLALFCLMASTSAVAEIKVGEAPPDYLGKTRDSEKVHISDHRGKVVIVNFWATWCKPCHKELPVLSMIQQKAGHERLEVFSINYREDRRTFQKACDALGDLDVTILRDVGSVSKEYDVAALPFLVIVGKSGLVKYVTTGYDESEIPKLVDKINEALME